MSTLSAAPWAFIYEELGISVPVPDHRPLGAYITAHAHDIPDQQALRYLEREFTYAELNRLANQLANALVACGVGKGDVVGIQLPNIPQYPIALIAISKIGAAASGVSPLLVPTEVAYQVQDAGISVMLSLDNLAQASFEPGVHMPDCLQTVIVCSGADFLSPAALELPKREGISFHDYLPLVESQGVEFEQRALEPDDIFLVQYTGGTTGRPKGAMLSVSTVMNNPQTCNVYRPWETGSETTTCALPLFHVAGASAMICSLRYGARVILIPDARDVAHICQEMIAWPPTRLGAVPSLYQMIVEHPASKNVDFSGLKLAMTGAAPITGESRTRLEALIGKNRLSDAFGMTETGPTYVVNPPDRCKPESVGIPVPGVDARIVDVETGTQEMPHGEPGEIITTGPQLMKGYLNLPQESARALRQWQGKTWMYTGDVGYMDEEGYIYICDRAKDMLIVGGFKVFSVEVEEKLASLEFVAQSAVVGTPDLKRPGNDVVNLYVELRAEFSDMSPEDVSARVTAYCRDNMAAYKVPKNIHVIDVIPLTAVGKIDKKALRAGALEGEGK